MREPKKFRLYHDTVMLAGILLVLASVFEMALSSPSGSWPSFPKRNVQALARDGHLRPLSTGSFDFKRSISTLAKNGQLPTFRAPEDNHDEQDTEDDIDKRNIASIARMRSFRELKRNLGSMMRNGFRAGKRDQFEDFYKRNIGSLARNGYLKTDQDSQKRDNALEDEYYYPFYQNPIPPISEIDGPLDYNELYDFQQSNHPDVLPPLSEIYDKRNVGALLRQDAYNMMRNNPNYRPFPTPNGNDDDSDHIDKRSSIGLPNLGLYRTLTPTSKSKRLIFTIPEMVYKNDINWPDDDTEIEFQEKRSVDTDKDPHVNFEKRHIGALARLGWLPSFRYSGSRYSRSSRARFLMPSVHDNYRKHSNDEDFGAREHITDSESGSKTETSSDYADLSPPPVFADTYWPSRGGGRPMNPRILDNEDDYTPDNTVPHAEPRNQDVEHFIDAISKNRWDVETKFPKFYNFRSLKVPRNDHRSVSDKRFLLLPAVDNIMLRKTYPNNNLPSRRKNQ